MGGRAWGGKGWNVDGWRLGGVAVGLVWFGLIRDRSPRHRNDLLSGRFALASSCAVATYWSMPPLTAGGLLLCTPPGPAADGGLHGSFGRWGLHGVSTRAGGSSLSADALYSCTVTYGVRGCGLAGVRSTEPYRLYSSS